MNQADSVQSLTSDDIDLALTKLAAETRRQRPVLRIILAVVIGSAFYLAIGAIFAGIALAIQKSAFMWVAWGAVLVLYVIYLIGKRSIPESSFEFSSTFIDRLKNIGLTRQQIDTLGKEHGLFSNLSCLPGLVFALAMWACILSWPALDIWSLVKGEAPLWLWVVAVLTLIITSIVLVLNEIRVTSYYQDLLQLESYFKSLRAAAQESGEPVMVDGELLDKFKKVESEQRLRESKQAFQEANFISQEEVERKYGLLEDDDLDSNDVEGG